MARQYLHCETGAYINLDHVSRFFVSHDYTRDEATIEVNVIGLNAPQIVMGFCDKDDNGTAEAKQTLLELVTRLEAQ